MAVAARAPITSSRFPAAIQTAPTYLIAPDMQTRHPAFVLAPQMPGGYQWGAPRSDEVTPHAALVLELLASLSKEFAIDSDRVYLVGQSLGGRGTWDLISKRPELFAAAVPLCGDGSATRITKARAVPVWAFHGAEGRSHSGHRVARAGSRAQSCRELRQVHPSIRTQVTTCGRVRSVRRISLSGCSRNGDRGGPDNPITLEDADG